MIRTDKLKGHDAMCGGYAYSGYVSFDGVTVKEVLEEIKEYYADHACETYDEQGRLRGKKGKDFGGAWGIRINGIPYLGTWLGWKNEYNHQFDDLRVKRVRANGGWYCSYDFDIETYETKHLDKETVEIVNNDK